MRSARRSASDAGRESPARRLAGRGLSVLAGFAAGVLVAAARIRRLRRGERMLERALEGERRALDARERSERQLRRLVDAMNEGLVTVDGAGRITWLNRSLCEMTGYAADEVIGRHPTEFVDEENARIFRREFTARESGDRRAYEIEWIRKDGSRLSTLVAPQPVFDGGDMFAGSVSVVSDITALKQAEEALRLRERRFRELVDYANSIILRWDVDGTIRYMNPHGLAFFGYRADEILGRNVIGTIVPATDSSGADLVAMIADIAAHPDRHVRNENETRDARGNRYWVVWTNRGIRDPAGRIAEVLSIGTDITELKLAREELARQRDELAELNGFIRRVFGRYVSDAVVRRLLDSPEGLEVGGTTRCVSILVADVRGFSSICEELRPEQVIAMLNTYLEVMTGVIEKYEGTIDEFIGDAILVLFGAPMAVDDHAWRSVACALAMQRGMRDVNRRNLQRGLPALEIGIGVHTGVVVAGNIGCAKRAKYGVVGASMNLASRIESYTVGGQILISEETLRRAGDRLVTGSRLRVEPKGVRAPIAVHEVLGIRDEPALDLPHHESAPTSAVDVPCRYCVLEEKFVGRTAFAGRIVALSETAATLLAQRPVPLLANLKILLADGVDLHAKVVDAESDTEPPRIEVRFTSVSRPARRYLSSVTAAAPR